jgi:hypothetical protein
MQPLPGDSFLEREVDEGFLFKAMSLNPFLFKNEEYKFFKSRILLSSLWAEREETIFIRFLRMNLLNGSGWLVQRNNKKICILLDLFIVIRKLSIQLRIPEDFFLDLSRKDRKRLYFKRMNLVKKRKSLKNLLFDLEEKILFLNESHARTEALALSFKMLSKLDNEDSFVAGVEPVTIISFK